VTAAENLKKECGKNIRREVKKREREERPIAKKAYLYIKVQY
jgi:hypothetical protein